MIDDSTLEAFAEEILQNQFSKGKEVTKQLIIPTIVGLCFGGLICTISERSKLKKKVTELEERVDLLEYDE